MPRRWDRLEADYLIRHAGRDTVHDIASVLSRSRHDVRRECAIRGLNARAPRSRLVTCPVCEGERTRLVNGRDMCRVCATRAAARKTRMRITMELAAATPDVRARFSGSGTPAEPIPRPMGPRMAGLDPWAKQAAVDRYMASLEQWELAMARRDYDAARAKLHRLRVAMAERRSR